MKSIPLLFLVFLATAVVNAQSTTIKRFIEEDRTGHRFYFYPSTLRMLNLEGDAEYYEMIRHVEKLVFFPFKEDRFDEGAFRAGVHSLQEENFEEYLSVEAADGAKLYISGKSKPYETVALARVDGQYYAADLQGSINLLHLTKLYQKIAERDTAFSQGFLNIFQLINRNKPQKDPKGKESNQTEEKDRS
ncbi:MAG: hypothetical protein HKN87_18285 [Saprospiraceae bacterium]|nr:hypothetical protein [Saprospiraceae bacterium]